MGQNVPEGLRGGHCSLDPEEIAHGAGETKRSPAGKLGNLVESSHYEESVTDMGRSTNSSRKFTALRLLQDSRERLNVLQSCFREISCAERPAPERRESTLDHCRDRTEAANGRFGSA